MSEDGGEIGRLPLSELPEGSMRRLPRPPFDVLVAHVQGRLLAIEDACPHSGRSLSEGRLEGCRVVCAGHGWVLDLASGEVLTEVGRGESNPTFRVQREGGDVVVYER